MAPLGMILVSFVAINSKVAKGVGGSLKILKPIIDILKKKRFQAYLSVILKLILDIRELQMKCKKQKGFRCVKGAIAFLNSLKESFKKTVWETMVYIHNVFGTVVVFYK